MNRARTCVWFAVAVAPRRWTDERRIAYEKGQGVGRAEGPRAGGREDSGLYVRVRRLRFETSGICGQYPLPPPRHAAARSLPLAGRFR